MKKTTTRKLEETSWLAQSITDMMTVEFEKNGQSSKWLVLRTFKFIVRCADTGEWGMFYDNDHRTNNRLVVVPSIPYGMQPDFLGLQARYQDAVNVLTTHDLNSAIINISRLMDFIRYS
jgi:hypothetical protein